MISASICTIGDEILIGQIVDTNSSAISRALGEIGIKTTSMESVGDSSEAIIEALQRELSTHDIVVVTGGLGPTKDDITKAALASLTGADSYYTDEPQLEIVKRILHSRGLDILDINLAQASVPSTCKVIPNRFGTAPIMVFPIPEERFGHRAVLYSLPGVPFETLNMLPDVIEDIKSRFSTGKILHRNIMTYGIAESALAKIIESWEDAMAPDMHLAYLPNQLTGVKLRISIYGAKEKDDARLDKAVEELKDILGDAVYSDHESSLEQTIGEILKSNGKTLSAAESCTGGEISHLITTVAGSSAYYLGSVTSYAVAVKEKVLGVPSEVIANQGIVSAGTAAAMAQGVRKVTGSDYSVATTGFAGPGGGDEREPEGTVWVGICGPKGTVTRRFEYHNDRKRNIERFAASALYSLLQVLRTDLQ